MSLDGMIWGVNGAPVKDVAERAVLATMADPTDEDGCGSLLSTATIAERTRLSTRTVQRCIDDMLERKLIGLGDQSRAAYLRADRRPVVYDLLIPYSSYGKQRVEQVNSARALKGLPPLTAENRPDVAPPPPKRRRSDVGQPRPKKDGATASHPVEDRDESDGLSSSHPVENPDEMDGVTSSQAVDGVTVDTGRLVDADGVTSNSPRGVRESPEPVFEPEDLNPPLHVGEEVTPARAREAEPREGEGNLPNTTPALAQLVAEVRDVRSGPGWEPESIIRAANTCLESGKQPPQIRKALLDAAHDPDSKLPNRINNPSWWAMTQASVPAVVASAPADAPRCPEHPGDLAGNCTGCKVDQKLAKIEAAREAKAAAEAESAAAESRQAEKAAGESPAARSLARQIAATRGRKPRGRPGPAGLSDLLADVEASIVETSSVEVLA